MQLKTNHFSIMLTSRKNVTNKTKFTPVPRTSLTYNGKAVYLPIPETMMDISFADIYGRNPDSDGPIGIGVCFRNPKDQPNRQAGMMMAMYRALHSMQEVEGSQTAMDMLVAELSDLFANTPHLRRYAQFWDAKYIDNPDDLNIKQPTRPKKKFVKPQPAKEK